MNLQGSGTAGTAVEGKAFHAESNAAVKAGESLVYLERCLTKDTFPAK